MEWLAFFIVLLLVFVSMNKFPFKDSNNYDDFDYDFGDDFDDDFSDDFNDFDDD